ncbi:MAG: ATP-binding cassette domain-containing protein [Actinopolymorphaceae bacterium]
MPSFDLVPTLRRYALHAKVLWHSAPGWSALCLALTVLSAAARTGGLMTTGGLIGALPAAIDDGFGSPAAGIAWAWFGATAGLFVAAPVAASVLGLAAQAASARYLVTVVDMMMEAGTHPFGIAHLEDPRSSGRFAALAQAPKDWLFLLGVDAGWTYLANRLSGIGALVVVVSWNWWGALVAVAGWLVLGKAFARFSSTLFDELLDITGTHRRRATYLHSVLTGEAAAKEVRLFGLAGWLGDQYATAWQEAMRAVWANRGRGLRLVLAVVAVPLAANALLFGLLARDAWTGAMSVGALVTLVQAVLALQAFGPQGDPQMALDRTASAVAELVELRREYGLPTLPAQAVVSPEPAVMPEPALFPEPALSAGSALLAEPASRAAAVDLTDVAFGYPSRDEPTLAGLNLHIPAGQSVAVVGVNGAGKSTLIKLLCGLYRPDSGSVAIDRADPGTQEVARRRVAVIFQDFVRYQLPLRDNVAAGAVHRTEDDALLSRALADAGGEFLLTDLDHGWDTVLSPAYTRGTDLSGGQWQRVALARALAALGAGAGLLVLDEPTAALDVRAEAALFERFLDVTRGATTLLVSHRLSSVRRAERIVVLGAGADDPTGPARIVEDGTHEELLAAGGAYAAMFTLQAARFAAAGAVA